MTRLQTMLDGIRELIDSKTWRPDRDDLTFAVGYVCSYVRQVTQIAASETDRECIRLMLAVITTAPHTR
jgi:hypothetical protein